MDTFHLEITTPAKVLLSDDVESVVAPGTEGEFQVLPGHTPFLTALTVGPMIYSQGGRKTYLSITRGFCEVKQEKTVVLVQTAEFAEEIDRARAEAARERAQQRLEPDNKDDIDVARAEFALKRAINRIRVSQMHGSI